MSGTGLNVTILGCGTSGGVPRIDGYWGDCDPEEPKNRRRRVSILVQKGGTRLVVDTSPDFREQMLDAGVTALDAVLLTHEHADHTHGIDDLRGLWAATRRKVPVYSNRQTLDVMQERFGYLFERKRLYPAVCEGREIDGPFSVGEIDITPFEQIHGPYLTTLGFRFGPVAYSTDLNELPDESKEVLRGVDTWIVDALRFKEHPTHPHLDLTLEWIEEIRPRRAILTHMAWDMDYNDLRKRLPEGVEPAYDGLHLKL